MYEHAEGTRYVINCLRNVRWIVCFYPTGWSDRRVSRVVVLVPASYLCRHRLAKRIILGITVEDLDCRSDGAVVIDVLGMDRCQTDASVRRRSSQLVVCSSTQRILVAVAVVWNRVEQNIRCDV